MKDQKFSIVKRLQSFKHAMNGLRILVKEEHNARIHVFAALCVIIAGYLFSISANEWIALVVVCGLVLILEAINSAIENIADFVSPDFHERIKTIKDLSAASVLIGAVTALIAGLIIFIPKIMDVY